MNRLPFDKPVTLLVGMGFPARIDSVMDAYGLLYDWPHPARNGDYEVAFNACKAGVAGEVDPEIVRAALETFARRNDILIADEANPERDAELYFLETKETALGAV